MRLAVARTVVETVAVGIAAALAGAAIGVLMDRTFTGWSRGVFLIVSHSAPAAGAPAAVAQLADAEA